MTYKLQLPACFWPSHVHKTPTHTINVSHVHQPKNLNGRRKRFLPYSPHGEEQRFVTDCHFSELGMRSSSPSHLLMTEVLADSLIVTSWEVLSQNHLSSFSISDPQKLGHNTTVLWYSWRVVFRTHHWYQNPWMLKSHSWPSVCTGSASADTTNHTSQMSLHYLQLVECMDMESMDMKGQLYWEKICI